MARSVSITRVNTTGGDDSTNGAFAGGVFTPTADNAIADIDQIESDLNAGTNVAVNTSGGGTQEGDIIIQAATAADKTISTTGTGTRTLRLNAEDDIFIDPGVTIQQLGGTLGTDKVNIVFNADSDASTTSRGGIYVGFGGSASSLVTLSTNGGNISFGGRDTTLTGAVGGATTFATGSSSGAIDSTGVFVEWSTLNSGGGAISMAGHGFAGGLASRGIIIQQGSDVNAAGGAIALTGVGGTGTSDNYGVTIGGGAGTQVRTIGTGTITITGTGGAGTGDDDHGVLIGGAGTSVSAVNGAITIIGTAGAGGGVGQGIRITQNAGVTSTGSGAISLTGTGVGSGSGSEGIALNVPSIGNNFSQAGVVTIGGASATGAISLTSLNGSAIAMGDGTATANVQTAGTVTMTAQGGGAITLAAGSTITGTSGVTLTADDIELVGTTTGTGVTLQTSTAGRQIDLGSNTAGTLGLTSAELNTITASGGTLTIGRNDVSASGNITVTGNIAPTGATTLVLMTGGSIAQAAGTVAETNLGLVAATGVTLTSAGNDVTALSGFVTGTGNFTYNDSNSFTVTGLAAVNATTTTGIQTTDGSIALQGTQVNLGADLLTNGTGGAASAVTVTGPVVLAAITVTVDTDTSGANGAGNVTFANAIEGAAAGANTLIVDASDTSGGTGGAVTFGGAVGATTRLAGLSVKGTSASFTGTNNVDFLAIALSGAGNAVSYTDADALTVGTVGGVTGIATNGGNVTLTAGAITVSAALSTTAAVVLNSSGATTLGVALSGIGSLTTDAAGTTAINGGLVTTTGAQTYHDAVTLGAATALTSTGSGAITFDSTVNNNGFGLTVTTGGTALFSGAISGGGGFTQAGGGTTTLAGTNVYAGATTINAGTLLVDGSIASSTTSVNTGTLGGSGTVGAVNITSGGALSPGASAGKLTAAGDVAFSAGASFKVELGGTTAGTDYDQLVAGGTLSLGGATLNASLLGSPVVATEYKIIDKTSAGAVSGTFAGLATNGATATIGGRAFQINYAGGDGNDVTLSLGALKISGTDPGPFAVLADENATTIDGVNFTSPTQSVLTGQFLNGDINGAVNAGVTVDGFGLFVTTTKSGGAIDFTNNGAIVVNAAAANNDPALFLLGNGGGVHYSGTGSLSNDATNTPNSTGLFIGSSGGVGGNNLIEVGGAITGNFGIVTVDGTTNIVVTGTVTGTNGTAIAFGGASNVVDLKPTAVITGSLGGSAADDTVRLSGVSGSGSFDLNKIAGGFSTLTKAEGSTWTVTGTFDDPNAATIIVNGALLVNGTIAGGVTVGTSFTETLPVPPPVLGGTGSVGNVLVQDKGILEPGVSAGTLTVTGNLTMSAGSILRIEIGGAGAGQFDVLNVNGTAPDTGAIELGAATLTGSLIGGFTPSPGQVFKIIDNAGADAIASPFNGISESGSVNFGGQTFTVSYVGGDGNDVTLTAVAAVGPPGLSDFGPTANVTQAGPAATPQVLDGDVVFTDAEGNFNGGTLAVSGLLAEDTVAVPSTGTDPGEFLIVENGAVDRLFFEGIEIGGISGGAGTTLNITFNGAATTSAIDALIENLTFLDLSANPTFERTLSLNVTDSAAASTGPKPLLVRAFNGEIQFGTPGDDSFAPAGNAHIDAGGGTDTITFDFRLVDATVTYSGNQVIIDAPSRHMVLSGFETYRFADGTVNNNDGDVLVDDLFYYAKYHDVWNAHADADAHYHNTGWHEGRDPDAFFSTVIYLSANPDVKAGGGDPLIHFDQTGWKEGRVPSINFDPAAYLAANPDVAAAHVDPLAHFLQFGAGEGRQPFAPSELIGATGFDYVFYLQHNPDVAASGVDPLQHFQQFGWHEGRNPNALFDTTGYLNTYLDVKAANVNPLDHYNQFGWHEGRDPSVGFDTTSYLAAYADVNAAQINPLTHFLHYGIHEGRSAFADGVWG